MPGCHITLYHVSGSQSRPRFSQPPFWPALSIVVIENVTDIFFPKWLLWNSVRCACCNEMVHCLLARILNWHKTKLGSVEVFGNGIFMVAGGRIDTFLAGTGSVFHVTSVPMIFILWTLHQISTISEIDNLLFCHGRFWPTIFWLGLSQQSTSIVSNLYKFVHIGLWIVTYYWEHLRKISGLLPAKNGLFGQFHGYFCICRGVTSMGGELPL